MDYLIALVDAECNNKSLQLVNEQSKSNPKGIECASRLVEITADFINSLPISFNSKLPLAVGLSKCELNSFNDFPFVQCKYKSQFRICGRNNSQLCSRFIVPAVPLYENSE